MKCTVFGCGRNAYSSGFCSRHYNRQRTTGTTDDGPRARLTFEERLWRQINRCDPELCWPWTGKSMVDGYGKIGEGGRKGRQMLAHRAVWELVNGPIPRINEYHGMVVMHTCDNRACCNPSHLRLGRQADNVKDMDRKKRRVNSPHLGEAHGNAKLTNNDVRAIRKSTHTNVETASAYGITRQNVRLIRLKKAWRHIK